jgi:hypothetical protein
MLRQTQSSPMSLTTKKLSNKSSSSYADNNDEPDDAEGDTLDNDYEDVPTDLSMDTDRNLKIKEED